LNIDIGEVWSKEERTISVGHFDNLRDLSLQFLGILDLLVEILGLKKLVEGGYDVAIDLYMLAKLGKEVDTHTITPKSTGSSKLRIPLRKKCWST